MKKRRNIVNDWQWQVCRCACFLLIWIGSGVSVHCEQPHPKQAKQGVLIRFEGAITPLLEQFIYRKLEVAEELGADLIVLEIDSPGGMLQPSENLAKRMLDIQWAHTVAYVPREALSGAAIAALGCDEILMGKHARMGDAGPIFQDEGFMFQHVPEKFRSDLAARVRILASATNRPPALVEAMVDMDLEVFRVRNKQSQEEWFMSQPEIDASDDPDQWEKLNPVFESRKDKFLEVDGPRAVELQLADAVVSQRTVLKQRYQLPAEFIVLEPNWADTAVIALNVPVVTGLLFVIGLIAVYVEFSTPGIGLGALIAFLCFALFFWSRFLGGTAGWLEVVLFLSGIVFIAMEIFVLPGFGFAGITGIFLLMAGLVFASHRFVFPATQGEVVSLFSSLVVVIGASAVVVLVIFVLVSVFKKVPVLGRMTLGTPGSGQQQVVENSQSEVTMVQSLGIQVGDVGLTTSPLRPAGNVQFDQHYVDVVAEGVFVESGRHVQVMQIQGNRVVVREIRPVI